MTPDQDSMATCPVCESHGRHLSHRAEEKMFGLGGSFTYFECSNCGSLALQDVPLSLAEYYPSSYYALTDRVDTGEEKTSAANGAAMRLLLRSRGVGRAAVALGRTARSPVQPWTGLLGGAGLDLGARILDVGCGDGHRLRTLRRFGFRHLTGIDAHLVQETGVADDIVLSRHGLADLQGEFDLVMFHHSFEHMPDPPTVLGEVARLLAPSGLLLLRIPLAGSWAWRTYGVDWVQLDAPRHLYLFTRRGLETLAVRSGFRLRRLVYDSGPFQFWGSDLYRQGTSLQESGSLEGSPPATATSDQIERWEKEARKLNVAEDGDQAAFLFTKADGSTSGA